MKEKKFALSKSMKNPYKCIIYMSKDRNTHLFKIPTQCVKSNWKVIISFENKLRLQKQKSCDVIIILKLLSIYTRDAQNLLPRAKYNNKHLDYDEDQNQLLKGPSSSKSSKVGDKKTEKKVDKNDEGKRDGNDDWKGRGTKTYQSRKKQSTSSKKKVVDQV